MPDKKIRVTAVFINQDRVLLIHRFRNGEEYWTVPGGTVEPGETEEEALVREILEETSKVDVSYHKITEITAADGTVCPIYKCRPADFLDIKLGDGPESRDQSADNVYLLEWVSFYTLPENIYPKGIRDLLIDIEAHEY